MHKGGGKKQRAYWVGGAIFIITVCTLNEDSKKKTKQRKSAKYTRRNMFKKSKKDNIMKKDFS